MKIFKRLFSNIYKNTTIEFLIAAIVCIVAASIYLFPIFQGLIVLPLDLLVSNYLPWYIPGNILLKNPYMQDSIVQMYPWRHLVFQSLTSGVIPFWNPYQFLGAPFMASLKPLIFFPTNILFIFGEGNSWNILLFFQIVLSLLFSYILARNFKLSIPASALAAISFGLCSLMIGVLEFGSEGYVILWIPLFILFAKKFIDTSSGRYLFLLGLVISLSVLAGQLQYSTYGLIIFAIFVLIYGFYNKISLIKYLLLFVSSALGVGMSSFLILPGLELFSLSHRGLINSSEIFNSGLINPILLLRLFSPDFFGSPITRNLSIGYIEMSGFFGIIPLFFAIFALIFVRKNIFVKIFSVTFILAILFSIKYIGSIIYLLHIPIITSGSGGRIFLIVLFSGALLSGFGLMEFIEYGKLKRNLLYLCSFIGFFAASVLVKILLIGDKGQINEFIHNVKFSVLVVFVFFFLTLIFLFFLKRRYVKTAFILSCLLLTFIELFAFGYRFLTFSNQKFLYQNLGVVNFIRNNSKADLSREFGTTEPELSTYINTYSTETYNPLYLMRTANFLQAAQGKEINNVSNDNKYFLSKQPRLKNLLDFLGVSLITADKNINPSVNYFLTDKYQSSLSRIYVDDRYAVFRNKNAFPRFYLAYNYVVEKDDNKILSLLRNDLPKYRDTIILEEKLPVNISSGSGTVTLISNNVNNLMFKVETNKPAIFYLSDTYYPGWQAKVNGNQTTVLRANYNFRAVLVPKGNSIVELNYLPDNFILGLILSFISLVGLILLSFFQMFKKHLR